jgi:hypothetical protein
MAMRPTNTMGISWEVVSSAAKSKLLFQRCPNVLFGIAWRQMFRFCAICVVARPLPSTFPNNLSRAVGGAQRPVVLRSNPRLSEPENRR